MGMLYASEYKVTPDMTIRIPTVGEIIDSEAEYYRNIALIVSTPSDMMVALDDMGIDYTKITSWDLFRLTFNELKNSDTSLIFKDCDLKDYTLVRRKQGDDVVLLNIKNGSVIDMMVHERMCRFLCDLLKIERKNKIPAGEETKKYLLERARKHLKYASRRPPPPSQIETLIVALVNSSEFPYNYETVKDITIFQFYASVAQVINRVSYDKLMIGYYAGTVDIKKINPDSLSWIPKKI